MAVKIATDESFIIDEDVGDGIRARYIPRTDAPRYRRAGWSVFRLGSHHSSGTMLAVRRVKPKSDIRVVSRLKQRI